MRDTMRHKDGTRCGDRSKCRRAHLFEPLNRCVHRDAALSDKLPRLPLLYGSAQVEICPECGSWRRVDVAHDSVQFRWRPAAELLIDLARDVLGWDDPQ